MCILVKVIAFLLGDFGHAFIIKSLTHEMVLDFRESMSLTRSLWHQTILSLIMIDRKQSGLKSPFVWDVPIH
jgi:hypothetical protein